MPFDSTNYKDGPAVELDRRNVNVDLGTCVVISPLVPARGIRWKREGVVVEVVAPQRMSRTMGCAMQDCDTRYVVKTTARKFIRRLAEMEVVAL